MDIYRLVPDDDERKRISKVAGVGRDYDMDLVLATIKKVFRWGSEECLDHVTELRKRAKAVLEREDIIIVRRAACEPCWLELKKELDKGAIGRKIGFGYIRNEIK